MPDRDLTDPLHLQGDQTILCPECGHGIDPHGIDPGGQCGVGDAQGVLCQCFMSPNEIARAHIAKLETSAQLLGAALAEYNSIALAATGTVPDMERGDGTTGYVDWQGVWEQMAELRPKLDAAHTELQRLHNDTQQHYAAIAAKQQRYARDHDIYRGALRDAARMLTDLGVTNPPPRFTEALALQEIPR